ncbi:MAG: thioredoxin family protein [Candidatus Levyibacteriota bacterium]
MANSTMLPLGTVAPDFNLTDVVSGQPVSLDIFKDKKALLVMFICKHCPFVQHVKHEIAKIGKDYVDKGLGIVAISSNDAAEYPEDAPAGLAQMAKELDLNFPYLYDESQYVAKAYSAACTPDFFLFDKDKKLFYRGQLDDSRPGNDNPVTGENLRDAIDKTLAGEPAPQDQKPSMGCGIKWKPDNEPS